MYKGEADTGGYLGSAEGDVGGEVAVGWVMREESGKGYGSGGKVIGCMLDNCDGSLDRGVGWEVES